MKKLNEFERAVLADGAFFTNKLSKAADMITRMLECNDITIEQQAELKIARKALFTAWNTISKTTHL